MIQRAFVTAPPIGLSPSPGIGRSIKASSVDAVVVEAAVVVFGLTTTEIGAAETRVGRTRAATTGKKSVALTETKEKRAIKMKWSGFIIVYQPLASVASN